MKAATRTNAVFRYLRRSPSHILFPIVLAASFAAFYARLLRANLIETMSEDYIRTARAKGLPERRVIGRHAMRAAITPIVTILGLDIGILIGGAILTEYVFKIRSDDNLLCQFTKETPDVRLVLNLLRPGAKGILSHTMYFQDEIRQVEEFRTDTSLVKDKELAMAKMLILSLEADFERFHADVRAA